MARVYPFRALRYDLSRVALADVVTQPYDKISAAMQERYYALSPHNLVRVILGKVLPRDSEKESVYTRAAAALAELRADGILKEEAEPALYGYAQMYTVPGTEEVRERRGFIGLGGLHDYEEKIVYRHEQTFPKHKSDRLALFKATRAYCEQIYMLYADPTFTAEKLIFGAGPEGAPSRPADLEVTDEYGVEHRVWKLSEPKLIQEVVAAMADKPLIIADGHHRYETSTTYMHERAAELGLDEAKLAPGTDAAGLPVPAFPEAAMMMTFVNMDAPGITILPTHRVVFGLIGFHGTEFAASAEQYFDVTEIPSTANATFQGAASLLKTLNATPGVAFVAATRDGDFLLRPKADVIAPLLAKLSPRQAGLDVTQLHTVVLEKLLGLYEETVRAGSHVRYVREASEALQQVGSGNADVAFLIKPVTLAQMKDVSLNMEVMPQKSTDFYPKLLSGLAMYSLDS